MYPTIPFALGALALILPALAHRGCGGHELIVPRAPAVTDLASSEVSKDPTEQCAYYNYQPAIDIRPKYPTIWETATIQANDQVARDLFNSINATVNQKIPNASLKPATGTTGYNYDRADPDCWWSWQGCTKPNPSLGLQDDIVYVPEPNTLGLTVDDGPNCSQNAFYDYLREQNQKATMFFIGSNIMGWPLQAIRALADGHEICVHTWSHQLMTAMTNEQAFAELYYTRQIIKDLLGVTPLCWRPPQGDVDNRIRIIAQGLNLTNVIWSEETDDWRAQAPGSTVTPADVDKNYQAIVDEAKSGNFSTHGGIILAHQSSNYTMTTLMKWIPQLRSAFAHVVPLASAFNWTHPYLESNITYPDFATYIKGETNSTTTTGTPRYTATSTSASGGSATGASQGGNNNNAATTVSSGGASSTSKAAGFRDTPGLAVGFLGLVAAVFAL